MKRPARRHGLIVTLTPLVDVIFLLIVFFLVTAHFARAEPAIEVELPKAERVAEAVEPSLPLTVTLTENGLFVGSSEVSAAELTERLKQVASDGGAPVRIRADRTVPFGRVRPILKTCVELGLTETRFAVEQTDSR